VHLDDPTMGDIAPDHARMELTISVHVADKLAAPDQQWGVRHATD
jgi:hypothetical protein